LPSAALKTLGKKQTLGKLGVFPSVKTKTIGKDVVCRVLKNKLGKEKKIFFSGKEREEKK